MGSSDEQWRNALASCGNLQLLCHSGVLEQGVQSYHKGTADQGRREVRAKSEVPVSQSLVEQAIHSPPLGSVLAGTWKL